jgi:hypothetical protein
MDFCFFSFRLSDWYHKHFPVVGFCYVFTVVFITVLDSTTSNGVMTDHMEFGRKRSNLKEISSWHLPGQKNPQRIVVREAGVRLRLEPITSSSQIWIIITRTTLLGYSGVAWIFESLWALLCPYMTTVYKIIIKRLSLKKTVFITLFSFEISRIRSNSPQK